MKQWQFSIQVSDDQRPIVSVERLVIQTGKINFLFGESGIGKTLLSKTLFGIAASTGLDIRINNLPYERYVHSSLVKEFRKKGFFVFQEPSTHLNPQMRIIDQLNEGDLAAENDQQAILSGLWRPLSMEQIRPILNAFPRPYRPSGGEKQRILLAMALKKLHLFPPGPESLYVFDEPTGSLDDAHRNRFLEMLLAEYERRPFTILFITHDYSIISQMYDRFEHLIPSTVFRELRRLNVSQVAMRNFAPDNYLKWLNKLQPLKKPRNKQQPVVYFDRDFRVFNRRLELFKNDRPADLQIFPGEMAYLKAPSGQGKTTLAKSLMGFIKPDRMKAELCGHPLTEKTTIKYRSKHIWGKQAGLVFQHADEALNAKSTVFQSFLGLPLRKNLSRETLLSALQEIFDFELRPEFLDQKVAHLSGGQKQRLNIMRTLILDLELIILDEPLNGLDLTAIKKVLTLINKRLRNGTAFLVIAHNEEIFSRIIPPELTYYLGESSS